MHSNNWIVLTGLVIALTGCDRTTTERVVVPPGSKVVVDPNVSTPIVEPGVRPIGERLRDRAADGVHVDAPGVHINVQGDK